jgi:DNA invertase Pin-like site-specific DNA recombinase
MTEGTRVCAYVRCSTEEQADKGASLEAQRHAVKLEARRHGWKLADSDIFSDVASGKSLGNRPGLEAAIEAVESGRCAGLIVSKLDRLSRNVRDFAGLLERFQRAGWGLVVMDLGVDTSTIMGAAMAQMVSVFAELERKRIGERTREGLAAKQAAGTLKGPLGRPRALPDKIRERIRSLSRGGESYSAIARLLDSENVPTAHGGRWQAATVRKIAMSEQQ